MVVKGFVRTYLLFFGGIFLLVYFAYCAGTLEGSGSTLTRLETLILAVLCFGTAAALSLNSPWLMLSGIATPCYSIFLLLPRLFAADIYVSLSSACFIAVWGVIAAALAEFAAEEAEKKGKGLHYYLLDLPLFQTPQFLRKKAL